MSIIVEGPDGGGKSTLAEQIGWSSGLPVVHGGGPPKTGEEALSRLREPLILRAVYDRNVSVSEQVYGSLRGGQILPESVIDGVIAEMIQRNVLFIYCRPNDSFLTANLEKNLRIKKPWKSQHHCSEVAANYSHVLELYDAVFSKLRSMRAVVLDYDWTKGVIPCAE